MLWLLVRSNTSSSTSGWSPDLAGSLIAETGANAMVSTIGAIRMYFAAWPGTCRPIGGCRRGPELGDCTKYRPHRREARLRRNAQLRRQAVWSTKASASHRWVASDQQQHQRLVSVRGCPGVKWSLLSGIGRGHRCHLVELEVRGHSRTNAPGEPRTVSPKRVVRPEPHGLTRWRIRVPF